MQERLRGAGGAVDLPPRELLLLLFCLGKDSDEEVRTLAASSMASLDPGQLCAALDGGEYHPAILHACGPEIVVRPPWVRTALLGRPELPDVTREVFANASAALPERKRPELLKADTVLVPVVSEELLQEEEFAEAGCDQELNRTKVMKNS